VFNVLLFESFWLNDDLVIKEIVSNKPRTNNKPSTAPKTKQFFFAYRNVPKLYADSSAFTEDILTFTKS